MSRLEEKKLNDPVFRTISNFMFQGDYILINKLFTYLTFGLVLIVLFFETIILLINPRDYIWKVQQSAMCYSQASASVTKLML